MSTIADRLRGLPQQAETPTHSAVLGSAAPDAPSFLPAGPVVDLDNVVNALPREDNSYEPFLDQTVLSNALDRIVKGAISVIDSSGNYWTYAGDGGQPSGGDLYESNDYSYTKASKTGGYSIGAEEYWSLAEFDTLVIASNINDPVQSKTKGAGPAFADMITSTAKPQGRYVATVGNFVALGNISEASSGLVPNRIWWSGFRNPNTFDPSTSTQSDFEDLTDGGQVQGIFGGQEYAVIFQSNHIRRMTYRGDAAVFDFDPVDRTRGTPIPRSIVGRGRILGYISEDGFMMFDGLTSMQIGDGKVDRSFWSEFDPNDRGAVSSAIDPVRKLLLWAYPSGSASGGLPNKIVVYNYGSQRWATVDIDLDMIYTSYYLGINVDTPNPNLANIDTSPWANRSIDSSIYKGGFQFLSSFDREHRQNAFDGPALAMRMESKDLSLFAGQAAQVNRVRPIIEGPANVYIGKRNVQGESVVYVPAKPKSKNGTANFRTEKTKARYHRIGVAVEAGETWNKASGLQIYAQPRGSYVGN